LPLAAERGESPADAIVALYRLSEGDDALRQRLDDTLAAIARRWLTPDAPSANSSAVIELLDLIGRTRSPSPFDRLSQLVRQRAWVKSPELYDKLLLTLAEFRRELPSSVWRQEIEAGTHALSAYWAMALSNPVRALALLPAYARATGLRPDSPELMGPIFSLVEALRTTYGYQRTMDMLRDVLSECGPRERKAIEKALAALFEIPERELESSLPAAVVSELVRYHSSTPQRRLSAAQVRRLHRRLEPLVLIRNVESEPAITMEEAFARYSINWVKGPTLDSTSLALHSLRVADLLPEWLQAHGRTTVEFLRACMDRGFAVTPTKAAYPSLYATLNGIGVIKALSGIPQGEELVRAEGQATKALGRELVQECRAAATSILADCVRDGLVVDDPRDEHPTIHAIDFATSLLWNLGMTPESAGLRRKEIDQFVRACQETLGAGCGFMAHPSSKSRKPCTTTTSMALRLYRRSQWKFPFDTKAISTFILSMESEGGFRVFPEQLPTLSATFFSLEALSDARLLGSEWRTHVDLGRLTAFVLACGRGGGYAFTKDPRYAPNAHSTRYALRILDRVDREENRKRVGRERLFLLKFFESLYDAETGGFHGYTPGAHEEPWDIDDAAVSPGTLLREFAARLESAGEPVTCTAPKAMPMVEVDEELLGVILAQLFRHRPKRKVRGALEASVDEGGVLLHATLPGVSASEAPQFLMQTVPRGEGAVNVVSGLQAISHSCDIEVAADQLDIRLRLRTHVEPLRRNRNVDEQSPAVGKLDS
jgi:hypothetical protein